MVDKHEIKDMLESYARKVDYRMKDQSSGKDPLLATHMVGTVENGFCQDKLHIYLRIDDSIVMIHHYGSYCSLSHASAELFCEVVNGMHIDTLKILLDSLALYLKTSNQKAFEENKKWEMIYELAKMPMSATRKRCISLPWEATILALK